MASEIEAAAERLERWRQCRAEMRENCHEYAMDRMLQVQDEKTLIDWALSRLADDRAEREERARPIDAGRLPIKLTECREIDARRGGGVDLWHYFGDGTSVIEIPECKTQGAFDDLLRILKGGDE